MVVKMRYIIKTMGSRDIQIGYNDINSIYIYIYIYIYSISRPFLQPFVVE